MSVYVKYLKEHLIYETIFLQRLLLFGLIKLYVFKPAYAESICSNTTLSTIRVLSLSGRRLVC